MEKLFSIRAIILAGNLLLQLGTLSFHSRGAMRTPRIANPKLIGRRVAFCLAALITGLGLIPAGRATAQTFTTLHSFSGGLNGVYPFAGLVLSGNTLYGTTSDELYGLKGTVFAVNTDGTGFNILHHFPGTAFDFSGPCGGIPTNSGGATPYAGLILWGNTLYGTASGGGRGGKGTVFAINTDGTGFTTLHDFTAICGSTNVDGAEPRAGLILSDNTLYGTARFGGGLGGGTVFAVNTDGTGFKVLHSFNDSSAGAFPRAKLILSGETLYGTTEYGGSSGNGTIFKLNTNGMGFTTLHGFTGGSEGVNPRELVLSGNTLYGATFVGGSSSNGTVFAVNTDGSGFTNLHSFPNQRYPVGLTLAGNTLYGTTYANTVFAVQTNGADFRILHGFAGYPGEGLYPQAGVILSGHTLYGTTEKGGSLDGGTVFSLSFPPQLTITRSGANVILTWPTNVDGFTYAGFTLQSTTNPVSTAVWSTNSSAPVVVNGQNTVTNPASGTQKFFQLSR